MSKLDLHAEVLLHADMCGAWAMDTSGSRSMPFHLVEKGTAWLHTSEVQSPRQLGDGDFVLFPGDAPHCISSGSNRPPTDIMNKVPALVEGDVTSLLCGILEFRNPGSWSLLDSLPDAIVIGSDTDEINDLARTIIYLMISELERDEPGMEAALNEMACLVFLQVIRMQIKKGVGEGLLAALADRSIGRALCAIYSNVQSEWTVSSMAVEAGMSRTAFAERFHQMVGMTPMRYLTEWRMQEADHRLRTSDVSMAEIAEEVGYRSEVAFRKAFSKVRGETPGTVRRGPGQSL